MATHLKNLVLHELSLVDYPANEASKVTLFKRNSAAALYSTIEKGDLSEEVHEYIKRDFSQQQREEAAASGAAMPDGSFPIKSVKDLKNAVDAIGRAKDPSAAKSHIISRAKSLGAESELPDDWSGGKSAGSPGLTQTDKGGHSMSEEKKPTEIDALKAQVAELTKALEVAKSAAEKAATEAAEKAKKDPPKASAAECVDEEEMAKRVSAEVEKRLKAASEDEVIKVANPSDATKVVELRKSVVGEQMFEFAKAQQAEIAKAREETEMVNLAKQAESDLGALPGTPIAKAKVLKAISGLGEETKKQFLDMLKAGNAALKSNFTPLGVNKGGDGTDPEAQLEKMAAEHATTNKVSKIAAYDEVLKTDEGKRLYRESLKSAH